jgi:hypothetical protein
MFAPKQTSLVASSHFMLKLSLSREKEFESGLLSVLPWF